MIKVLGSTTLSFMFPADQEIAYQYYLDMGRIVQFLPHISLISASDSNFFRLAYETVELGAYHIRILCDVEIIRDTDSKLLQFQPVELPPEVPTKSGFNSASGRGYYRSESYFMPEGEQTRIEYHLQLNANLPTPLALKVVPTSVLNKIARNITNGRIKEIAGGFIEGSVAYFPQWLQEKRKHLEENA